MHYLLTILLSFYPTFFIYSLIPASWMEWIDSVIVAGPGFFFSHFVVFAVIYAIIYIVFSKYVSVGFFSNEGRGVIGTILMFVFTLAVALIAFYNILPGDILYDAPNFIDNYVLKNPYTFLWLIVPWGYLFFD